VWIEHPDVGYAEGSIVVHALLQAGQCVVFRKDFDADERRLRKDWLDLLVARDYADIGNVKRECAVRV
jgi:hypothetical protein